MKRHSLILSITNFRAILLVALFAGGLEVYAQSSRLWATYYGGVGKDFGTSTTTDANTGNVYLAGGASSVSSIASAGAFQTTYGGGLYDGMLVKFNSAGNRIWATYYGGNGMDYAWEVATDPATGDVYVAGQTGSTTGISSGGFQNSYGGGSSDAFLAKFNSAGVRQWATYYGGTGADDCSGLCVDASGNIYMSGYTTSTTSIAIGGFQNTYGGTNDIYLVKFNSAGVRQWATYYGANGTERDGGVSTDASGNVYLSGWTSSTIGIAVGGFQNTFGGGSIDAFLVKFNSAGVRQWATYYGGTGDDRGFSVANDPNTGDVYLAGTTLSPGLAIGGFQNIYSGTTFGDNFIVKFNPVGIRIWATYYGGADNQTCIIVTDAAGNVYLAGDTYSFGSSNLASGGFQNTNMSPDESCYLAKFDAAGNRLCATYYGRTHEENGNCAVDGCGNVYLSGLTPSDHDIASGGFQNTYGDSGVYDPYYIKTSDAFLVKFCPCNNTALALSSSNPACGSTCTGTATVKGIPILCTSYTYAWSTSPVQTKQTATGLCAGTYTVTVTNSSSCNLVQTGSVTITGGGNLNITSNNATCITFGSATVTATGSLAPYTYVWSNGQTAQTATGLAAGNYTVTVKDTNGCTSTQTTVITTPPPLDFTLTTADGICGNGGTASVYITTAGIAPFTYSWSGTAQTTPAVTALPAGNYTVMITDGNGCVSSKTFSITNPPNLASATFTQSPVGTVCIGTTVNFTNTGSGGFFFYWKITPTSPAFIIYTTNFSYTFLTAGTYTITHYVKVAGGGGGCSKTEVSTVVVVNCTGVPIATATGSSVCPGNCATVTSGALGGTAPYTYSWNNGATTQNATLCPAAATTYTVKITDSKGATATTTATITVTAITLNTSPTNIICSGGKNGSIIVNPGNGTAPYTYNWSAGVSGSGSQVSGLSTGNYTVTITDSKGCAATSSTTINSPPPLTGQFTKGTANCTSCGCKEWIMANATGGTSPYSYSWPDGYVNRYKNQLCPGNYTVNIKDKNGCSINVSLSVP